MAYWRAQRMIRFLWLVALALIAAALVKPNAAHAVEIENRLVSVGLPGDTGAGASTPTALNSADGRYVVFQSEAGNLIDGVVDHNGVADVFLFDRATNAVTLVSRSASSAMTTANNRSVPAAISDDGEWVLFWSSASDLVAGVTDDNGNFDAFLYQRTTGLVSLVSRSAGSVTSTASGQSFPSAVSANGEWVLFYSDAADLVAGLTDVSGTVDVFLFQRSTGVVSLVSRSGSATMTPENYSLPRAISADGEWVLFDSFAFGRSEVLLLQRSTGVVTLVSRSSSSVLPHANGNSRGVAISADGEWVLFDSSATNLVAGVTDNNGSFDVFLYRRSTDTVSLVSRSAVSAVMAANNLSMATGISADGQWVLFASPATDVVAGVTDSNGTSDVFIHSSSTGATTLVSRSSISAAIAASGQSTPVAISADGASVLFQSGATDLVANTTDTNNADDVYVYQQNTGAVNLVSRSTSSATNTANNRSLPTAISADGDWVLFRSRATDVVAGVTDSNTFEDVFVHQRSTGTMLLVSRSESSATTTANAYSESVAMSPDGEWVVFRSLASNLVAGVTDSNGAEDVFLYQRGTGTVRLVSRSATSPTMTANNQSRPTAISADGEWVLFTSLATDIVAGVTDSNGVEDVFLYRRSTGAINLISRSASSAKLTANNQSLPAAISADGAWVLFQSAATDLVAGVTDSNVRPDVFLFDTSTGSVRLVSRSAISATVTAGDTSIPVATSADGEWILFSSFATNLVAGVTDSNGTEDVFIFQRSTGETSLVSRSTNATTTTGNGQSVSAAISADGEWVLFRSRATNLAAGVADSNGTDDVFLFQRSTETVNLVSRSANSSSTTASGQSFPSAVSDDGEWVLFGSFAANVAAGVTDDNATSDVFIYRRSNGAVSLLSRTASSAAATANGVSRPTAISADGEWVLFRSRARNIVADVTEYGGGDDVYLVRRSDGEARLVSRSPFSATASVGLSSGTALSNDGGWVLLQSLARLVVNGVVDGNRANDVFLARAPSSGPNRIFADSFEL